MLGILNFPLHLKSEPVTAGRKRNQLRGELTRLASVIFDKQAAAPVSLRRADRGGCESPVERRQTWQPPEGIIVDGVFRGFLYATERSPEATRAPRVSPGNHRPQQRFAPIAFVVWEGLGWDAAGKLEEELRAG